MLGVGVGGIKEMHTGFWWGNLKKRDYLKDPGIDGEKILKQILRTREGGA
jgi:hypothetical protein